ncbi:hypothetical protein [Fodinicola acaciae]|uniref:hypothetical protein n=1 Tax=Fodinicola acaciae TaxID=2681555 RepID=UPI0013D2AB5A|nr:hypothetical protein [Fodinicola acaciae]
MSGGARPRLPIALLRLAILAGLALGGWLLMSTAAAYADTVTHDDAPPPIDLSGAAARAVRLAAEIDRGPRANQLISRITRELPTDVVDTVLGPKSPVRKVPVVGSVVGAVTPPIADQPAKPAPPTTKRPATSTPIAQPVKSSFGERSYVSFVQRPVPHPAPHDAAAPVPAPPHAPEGPPCAAPIGTSAPVVSPNGPVAVTESALHLLPASSCRHVAAPDRHSPADATRPAVSPD